VQQKAEKLHLDTKAEHVSMKPRGDVIEGTKFIDVFSIINHGLAVFVSLCARLQ
jgi:hypothetical protein